MNAREEAHVEKHMYNACSTSKVYTPSSPIFPGRSRSLEIARDRSRSLELRGEQRGGEAERDHTEGDQRAVDADGDHARLTCGLGRVLVVRSVRNAWMCTV